MTSATDDWRARALETEAALNRVVIGQEQAIRLALIAVLARGHVLLEGDVGTGKTTLLRALARVLGGPFARMEGAVDLMPSDLLYSAHIAEDGRPRVDPGPVLAEGPELAVFFFNEINRARPQVHSLLLRLMAERSVTAFRREHVFPHLTVFADRNRIERDETFELPAAARDRFLMEIPIAAPEAREARMALAFDTRFHDADTLIAELPEGILPFREIAPLAARIQNEITVSEALRGFVFALWEGFRDPAAAGVSLPGIDAARLVRGGASPRGISGLVRAARVEAWLRGRSMALPEDVRAVLAPVMGHRVFLAPVYEARREEVMPALIEAVLGRAPVPVAA
ncbi:MAG: AAA family ATPase [Rhodovulum sulfidophilum]|uniref:AAA family ATPase n=1 Tax=Rhodovulum sulfidophilum TaxID=35806 RepID=A0A2W5QAH4_RHOSU|nr:MAG: AAA family ATPase [Rhodovulum sulfidophilum]